MRGIFMVLVCCFAPVVAQGQRLTFGMVTGTGLTNSFPVTDYSGPADGFGNPAYHSQYLPGSRSLILGGFVEGRITDGWSVYAGVQRRPMNVEIVSAIFPAGSPAKVDILRFSAVDAWEFPLLVKRTFVARGPVEPFLAGGIAIRTQENANSAEPSRFGASAGAGVALHAGRLRIAPELRYTRWERENIAPKYSTKPDQLELLLSAGYELAPDARHVAGRRIEIGLIGGAAPGSAVRLYGAPVGKRVQYHVGAAAQVELSRRFAVEVDGIYHPLRASYFTVLTWEIPVLAKWRAARTGWTPVIEAGPSFRLSGNLNGYKPSSAGITVGAGAERVAHGLRFGPAVRYTRWPEDAYPFGTPGSDYSRTNPNVVSVSFGVSF